MAKRRMFSLSVTDTDAFLELSPGAQALYFHLGMQADDDGFIASPKKIARTVGCGEGELKSLIGSGLILAFDSGVVAVRDWRINNTLRNDRYHATLYTRERAMLRLDENERYCRKEEAPASASTQDDKAGHQPAVAVAADTGNQPVTTSATDTGNQPAAAMATEPNVTKPKVTEQKRGSTGAAEPHRAARFTPPREEELLEYCRARGSPIDIQRFLDYYASVGWRVGKNPMKDWKAAVRNWERRDKDGTAIHASNRSEKHREGAAKRFDELELYDVC